MYFTFHSGYIPIKELCSIEGRGVVLYIPFWIYSNPEPFHITGKDMNFTFHSGYIPMQFLFCPSRQEIAFTFHSGYIPIQKPEKH